MHSVHMYLNNNLLIGLGIILPSAITLICCLLFLICAFRHGCGQPCWFSKRSAVNEAERSETLAAANRSHKFKAASPTGDHTITHSITQHSDLCRSTASDGSQLSVTYNRGGQTYHFEEDELDAISWDKYKMRESMYAHLSSLAKLKEVSEQPTTKSRLMFSNTSLSSNQFRFSKPFPMESTSSRENVTLTPPRYNIQKTANQDVSIIAQTIANRRDVYVNQPFTLTSKFRHHIPTASKQINMFNMKEYENRLNLSCNSNSTTHFANNHQSVNHQQKLLFRTLQNPCITFNSSQVNANHRVMTIKAQTHLEQCT